MRAARRWRQYKLKAEQWYEPICLLSTTFLSEGTLGIDLDDGNLEVVMMRLTSGLSTALVSLFLSSIAPVCHAANFTLVTEDFGPNPRNVGFYIYVPDQLAESPPILVNPHW